MKQKKSDNTDVRRKVVGQMLDYAANAVLYWPIEDIKSMFEVTCKGQNIDPDKRVEESLDSPDETEKFWQKAKENLITGKIRLLFVSDEIPTELRRIVEFLNSQMNRTEVLAVEIKQYTGQDQRSLVPRVIGQTTIQIKGDVQSGRQWDEDSFFKDLESRKGSKDADIARKILEWAKDKLPRFWWGKGNIDGSVYPILDYNAIEYYPFCIWTYGKVEMQFQWLLKRTPFDAESKRKELLDRLNMIPTINIPLEAITRRPNISLSALNNEDTLKQFLEVLDWVVQEIKKS